MLTDRDLHQLRRGELTFEGYVRRTEADWLAIAGWLKRRWVVPAAVGVEDVLQELLIAAWGAIERWDEGRGTSLVAFVEWRAIAMAGRWLQVQRGALRRSWRGPSRFPRRFLGGWERIAGEERGPSDRVICGEEFEWASGRLEESERVAVLEVVRLGCAAEAGDRMYGDAELRRRCRWGCEAEARRFARRSLARLGEELRR